MAGNERTTPAPSPRLTRTRRGRKLARVTRLLAAALTLSLTLPSSACMEDPAVLEYQACRCLTEGCSPQACTFTLRLADTCEGSVEFAEVLVDEHLEEELLTFGDEFTPCTRTEPGDTTRLIVRGGGWIWIQDRTCQQSAEDIQLTLECVEASLQ